MPTNADIKTALTVLREKGYVAFTFQLLWNEETKKKEIKGLPRGHQNLTYDSQKAHPHKRTHNAIAICTGPRKGTDKEISMIDFDWAKQDEVCGMTWFNENQNMFRNYPQVETQSGGAHIVCEYSPELGQHTKLSLGGVKYSIDTRGKGGFWIIPPSRIKGTDRDYRWKPHKHLLKVDLKPAPTEFLDLLEKQERKNRTVEKPIQAVDFDTLREVVMKLDKQRALGNRDDWLKVGMAINYETGASKKGRDLFLEFSRIDEYADIQGWKKSTAKDSAKKEWDALNPEHANPVTFGSLVKYLQDDNPEALDTIQEHVREYIKYDYTDQGICDSFQQLFGDNVRVFPDICYLYNEKTMLWSSVLSDTIGGYIRKKMREYYTSFASDEDIPKIVKRFGSYSTQRMLGKTYTTCIEYREHNSLFIKQLNRKTWLVPFQNKVIDICTLEVRERRFDDFFTYSINRNYHEEYNECEITEQFVADFFKYKEDDIDYFDVDTFESFKKCMGYSLTAETSCKCLFILLGDSNSGKSTITDFMGRVLGDMVKAVPHSLFIKTRETGIDTDLQAIEEGPRIGTCSEFTEDSQLYSDKLKRLTGGDDISFRPMKNVNRTFNCITKFWISTNTGKIPRFDTNDTGIETRMVLFPFKNVFENRPGFLNGWFENNGDRAFSWLIYQAHKFYIGGCSFERTTAMMDLKGQVYEEGNPLTEFSQQFVETKDDDEYIPSWKICELYRYYPGAEKLTDKQITMYLSNLLPNKIKCDKKMNGRRVRILYCYKNLEDIDDGNGWI